MDRAETSVKRLAERLDELRAIVETVDKFNLFADDATDILAARNDLAIDYNNNLILLQEFIPRLFPINLKKKCHWAKTKDGHAYPVGGKHDCGHKNCPANTSRSKL